MFQGASKVERVATGPTARLNLKHPEKPPSPLSRPPLSTVPKTQQQGRSQNLAANPEKQKQSDALEFLKGIQDDVKKDVKFGEKDVKFREEGNSQWPDYGDEDSGD
jgi:hypothetical protein